MAANAIKPKRKTKLLRKKEIPSYQLALHCLKWIEKDSGKWNGIARHLRYSIRPDKVHALAKEIRIFRNEERTTN